MTDMLRYKWTSFGPMLDEDGPFVLLVDAEAAEARVREDERSNNFTPDDHADGICEAVRLGLAAARESVESQWTEDPSWDGTNWNNALASALASIDAPREN